ncbi:WYL domain-containing protein [Leucobacter sp. cx-328]|uniref:helix-turn-helix transcriptional regulator n=1 Tax=unclassified Leucobacter TaxID=2621730 RepID=UPI00165D8822|nr:MULTISPECIES: WYL domain-containing protein [unclassified Leucobacter]MBC9943956.1 WYL domain-containing protein [Leucobacter sp. cx-328]
MAEVEWDDLDDWDALFGPLKRNRPEQRLFNLVLALLSSERGLTKQEIFEIVEGYDAQPAAGETRKQRLAALERQFERDKTKLRDIGVPLEVIESPVEPGNNQMLRYRVSKRELQVPEGLTFSDRELMLLRLAALSWRRGSLDTVSRRATLKVEALRAPDAALHGHIVPRFGLAEPAAPALLAAIDTGESVRFGYQLHGRSAPLMRNVAPLAIHRFEGRWHLLGYDLDRDQPRVFLLSRITSAVKQTRQTYDRDLRALVPDQISALVSLQERQPVRVAARVGSFAAGQLRQRGEPQLTADGSYAVVEFGTIDYSELATELAAYGADIAVLEPASLRDNVRNALLAVAAAHAGEAPIPAAAPSRQHRSAVARRAPLAMEDAVLLLLALVPFLRESGPVSLAELGERFEVDESRLFDLIRFLGTAGIPGELLSYQHDDLFDIDWDALKDGIVSLSHTVAIDDAPRLSGVELSSLLLGLEALAPALSDADAGLAAGLRARLGGLVDAAGNAAISAAGAPADPRIATIAQAIEHRKAVGFKYVSRNGVESERVVDPYLLVELDDAWYLRGWCRERVGERMFLVAGMTDVSSAGPADDTHVMSDHRGEDNADNLVARLPARLLSRIDGFSPTVVEQLSGDRVRVQLASWHADTAARLAQRAPGELEVEQPTVARSAVREWAEHAARWHSSFTAATASQFGLSELG